MSLDFYLQKPPCECCGREETEIFWENITHNVTRMWGRAGCYDALYMSDGKKASDILEDLDTAYWNMKSRPDEYTPLNPENGWGSYDSALMFLHNVLTAVRENPEAIIHISK